MMEKGEADARGMNVTAKCVLRTVTRSIPYDAREKKTMDSVSAC